MAVTLNAAKAKADIILAKVTANPERAIGTAATIELITRIAIAVVILGTKPPNRVLLSLVREIKGKNGLAMGELPTY